MIGNKSLQVFLFKVLGLYILWHLLYFKFISVDTRLEEIMTQATALFSSRLMNLWGFETYIRDKFVNEHFQYCEVFLNDQPLLLIANACNGFMLIILFTGFILAYPGYWKLKVLYILFGSALIYLINLARIQVLLLNILYYEDSFNFNHKYTYTLVVYGCIFLLWMFWANRYSKIERLSLGRNVVTKAT